MAAPETNLKISSLFDVKDQVVLVTGGASGLGSYAARGFIENGARVIIASRKKAELEKVSAELTALGPGKCEYVVADLKNKAGCQKLCEDVKKMTDRLNVLVNNSGATWGGDYFDFPEDGWDKIYALNVKAMYYTTAGLHDLLTKGATPNSPNRVINISSMAAITTVDVTSGDDGGLAAPGTGVYSYGPSKAACVHLSRMQASKLMPLNVTVNCICPGVFPSRMTAFGLKKFEDTLVSAQPSGRVGTPEDFAGLVLFCASRAAAHMTGNVFEIDGGATRSGWRSAGKANPKPKAKI